MGYNNTEVLHGISFETIPHGMTAIVGPSGSGKSTVAKLLANFWDVKSGSITIGSVDVKNIPLKRDK
ncbi:ABC-type multidrug transport system fused ATPase/permease subunit [Clostridium algifaecis]|uniref:ABC-type multidrug transport system fused ATPase/permease subunit n=1 Tax=Clostridium algifaecis TaxID=1472040 RepID=A0ABS4KWK8_9CLOT|nr:ATP-binding cassette domain-containing protein [Clostridium algifaecis]MBP2033896.1 ABC-type multidrug transport system fused ATPase/permease subunit [Clostridium algifaecis]